MTNPIHSARPVLVLALMALTGCFSLGRDEPVQQHYVLGGDRTVERPATPDSLVGLTIALRQLDLAGYLKTPLIVVRQGPQQIRFSESQRWGEDPTDGITRTVATYLMARAPLQAVDTAPWPRGVVYDYTIQLHVMQFEGIATGSVGADGALLAPTGEARLLATWEILGQHSVLERGTTDFRERWNVGDYPALVELLDSGLSELANDLGIALASIATQ
jgi:uncharacterized lipoprotein YmbA